jgi:hypothetical protein
MAVMTVELGIEIDWANTIDLTSTDATMLINLSLAGIEARAWLRDEDAELADDLSVADLAAALILGARADVELLKRGILDAYLLRHRRDDDAAKRLTKKIAQTLPESQRHFIESEECDNYRVVDSVVAAQLWETAIEIVSPNPVTAYLDAGTGQRHVVVRAVVNDVIDRGRKLGVRKIEMESVEDGYEVAAVDEDQPLQHDARDVDDLPPEWLAAIALMQQRGDRMTFENLAATLGVSARHLRRIAQK